jgi:hypothetical protein
MSYTYNIETITEFLTTKILFKKTTPENNSPGLIIL